MAKWRYFRFRCPRCGVETQPQLFDVSEETPELHCECDPEHEEDIQKMDIIMEAPNQMMTALPDGTNRGRSFDRGKHLADLHVKLADCNTEEERKDVRREIKKA